MVNKKEELNIAVKSDLVAGETATLNADKRIVVIEYAYEQPALHIGSDNYPDAYKEIDASVTNPVLGDDANVLYDKNDLERISYVGTAKSILTSNLIDIYYDKLNQVIFYIPELSFAGKKGTTIGNQSCLATLKATVINNTSLSTGNVYSSEKSNIKSSSTDNGLFGESVDIIGNTLIDSVTPIAVKTELRLMNDLFPHGYECEYARDTALGNVNSLKDTPVQIISLEGLTQADKSTVDTAMVYADSPLTYTAKYIGRHELDTIKFAVHF